MLIYRKQEVNCDIGCGLSARDLKAHFHSDILPLTMPYLFQQVTPPISATPYGHFFFKPPHLNCNSFVLPSPIILQAVIEERKEAFMQQNEAASVSHCQAELDKLAESLRKSVSSGAFSVPGGHSLYIEARKKVEQNYERVPRKGVKANEVLKSFLQSEGTVENSILQSDKALTDGQKAIAAERTKKEVAEKERELLRQKQKEQEQLMEAQERSFRENIAKLQEKMEKERETLLSEQEKMLEHKLKIQEELLVEGFKKKSEMLMNEISHLREEIEKTKEKPSLFAQILDTVGNAFLIVLPGAGKLLGAGMKVLSSFVK